MATARRNDPCPCGSGKKFKHCCLRREEAQATARQAPTTPILEAGEIAREHYLAGRLPQAEATCQQILRTEAGNAEALHLLGLIAYRVGKKELALELIGRAIQADPNKAAYHCNLGPVYRALARLDEAAACYRKALELKPDYPDAHYNLANTLFQQDKSDAAIFHYQRALSLNPGYAEAHNNLGIALSGRGKPEQAAAAYRQALTLRPDYLEAVHNLGAALAEMGQLDAAIASYEKALAIKPDYADAHNSLAVALCQQGKSEQALASFRQAISLRPDYAEAYSNLGNALKEQGDLNAASECFRRALALRPDYAEPHNNLGNVFKIQGMLDEAIACYQQALSIKGDFVEAHCNLGNAFCDQGKQDQALACYRKALSLKPDYAQARWALTMAQIPLSGTSPGSVIASREQFIRELAELNVWFETHQAHGYKAVGSTQPFYLAYQEENNRPLLAAYGDLCCRAMRHWYLAQAFTSPSRAGDECGRIRIGIVSSHIRDHPVWHAIVKGWFRHLDQQRFSLHVFHLGSVQDAETEWAKSRSAYFEQGGRSLRHWVEAILGQTPDVLIYPEIGMDEMTVKLASLRLAPVQLSTWGHPETTGLPSIDYYLSADGLEPPEARDHYRESLLSLPHLGCCYQGSPLAQETAELAVPELDPDAPLIICPGSPFKYTPRHDWLLPAIAGKLGQCKFVFFTFTVRELSELLQQRLRQAFADAGLPYDQYVLCLPWQARPAFYGLMKRADVFLDTIGFSGFNTAMQAVECGLPIVTHEGRFLRGRLASGILKRIGLSELVVASEADYVDLAVRLVRDKQYHSSVTERIKENRHVLFDDIEPVRALECFLVAARGNPQ